MSPPRIRWVNHASYIVEAGGLTLATDPWLFGAAFNNGWDLLSATKLGISELSSVDYIWVSHEHPDHFAPAVLKAIPAASRERITVLYQRTRDGKVLDFCRKLGFQTQELPPREWISLRTPLRVLCGPSDDFDSWLLADADGRRILNLNDCIIDSPEKALSVRASTGQVDVLLTQFGYAQWLGNPDESALRAEAAREKLERIRIQAETFRPRFIIPFASYVYFSHEENQYL
ncbi:MAG TPA: MBL fold metallo-hydrolase, partial [Thermoanaerobaculia bacterium]